MNHTHRWITALVEAMEAEVDQKIRESILINCGRSCISRSFIKKAQKLWKDSEDLESFLKGLGEMWWHLKMEGEEVYVEYDRCYCPFLKTYSKKILPTWCNCSRGWTKELFESALDRPVGVELIKSIRLGDDVCRFKVIL